MNAYLRTAALYKSQLHPLDVRHWTSFLWSSDNNRSIFHRCLIELSLTVHCQITLINHHTRVKPITFTSHPHLQAITGHSSRVALTCNSPFEDSSNSCRNVVFYLFCLSFFPPRCWKAYTHSYPICTDHMIPIVKPWSLAHHLLEKDLQIWPWIGLV